MSVPVDSAVERACLKISYVDPVLEGTNGAVFVLVAPNEHDRAARAFRVILRTPEMDRDVAVVSVQIFELKCRKFGSAKAAEESGEDQTAIAPAEKSIGAGSNQFPHRRSKKWGSPLRRYSERAPNAFPGLLDDETAQHSRIFSCALQTVGEGGESARDGGNAQMIRAEGQVEADRRLARGHGDQIVLGAKALIPLKVLLVAGAGQGTLGV